MARVNGRAYYERRRARLLRGFDRFARYVEPRLARRYDAALAVAILADARVEFARLIPELPYIGGLRNIFTPVMMANGWIISLHRAMRARGQSVEDAVRVCAEVSDEAIRDDRPWLPAMQPALQASPGNADSGATAGHPSPHDRRAARQSWPTKLPRSRTSA